MVTPEDIVVLCLSRKETRYAKKMAVLAQLGGNSRVHDLELRMSRLSEDQTTGQVGQLAFSLYWFGDSRQYDISRWYANMHPTLGDKGYDIPGMRLDVKASRMRASPNPLDYRLAVRPEERHSGNVYVLALYGGIGEHGVAKVYLVGWAADRHLPQKPDTLGTFEGAFTIMARDLNPLPPIHWDMGAVQNRDGEGLPSQTENQGGSDVEGASSGD